MAKVKHNISYSLAEVPARIHWTVKLDLPPEKLGTLCLGLRNMTEEHRGGCFYYPDEKKAQTHCRYEWQIPWNGKKYGIRLGIQFIVTSAAIGDLELYAAYGDEHPNVGKVPTFSTQEISIFQEKTVLVLKEALDRQNENRTTEYNCVYYLELPPFRTIESPLRLDAFGATIIPTVILGKDNKRISAVVITISAPFEGEAKSSAMRRCMILASLLTLAEGNSFNLHAPEWPRNRKPRELVNCIDPLPSAEDIYPYRRWRTCADRPDQNFASRAQTIVALYSSLDTADIVEVTDPIFAYMAAKEIQGKQPTLATVAYMAALSSLSAPRICSGDVSCSICGALRQQGGAAFRHNVLGDRQALIDAIAQLFNIGPGSEEHSDLTNLASRVYGKHRSAYVHGATLRHGEYNKEGSALTAEPTNERLFSELHLYSTELLTLERITRKALLLSLGNRSKLQLDQELFNLTTVKFQTKIPYQMRVNLPGKETLVQLKLQPSAQPEETKGA